MRKPHRAYPAERLEYSRKALLPACCASVAADLYFMMTQGAPTPLRGGLFAVYALLCLSMMLKPRAGSLLLLVYEWTLIILPGTSASDIFIGVCLAFGVLTFMSAPWMSLLAQSCNIMIMAFTVFHGTGSPRAVVATMLLQMASGIGGYALRVHRFDIAKREERLHTEIDRERSDKLNRDIRLASRLHDDLTNNLSAAAMLCEARILSNGDPDERRFLHDIQDRIQESITCAHNVIDVLRDGTATVEERHAPMPTSWEQVLHELIADETSELDRHGFHGNTSIHIDSLVDPGPDVSEEITALLTEVYSNIRKHARPQEGSYSVELTVTHDNITLVQLSTRRTGDRTTSGRGLELHRRIIERLGGNLRTNAEDDTWMMTVDIPLLSPHMSSGTPSERTRH